MASSLQVLGPLVSQKTSWQATRPLVHSSIAFIVIDTVIVSLKTYSRLRIAKLPFWWDDFWIIVAYAFLMPICAMGIAMAQVEVAWNNEDRVVLNMEENEILLKMIYSLLQFLIVSYALTRYSILALYLRIFSGRWLRITTWCVVAFVTLQWLGFATTAIFQCRPVEFFWDRSIAGGQCLDVDEFYRSVTPFNLAVDVVLVFMPLPTVWQLKASNRRKWALTFLFGIGLAALVASAIRWKVYETNTAKYIAPSYTNVMVMWLVIEPSIYLVVACLPAMHSTLGRSKTGAASPNSDSRGLTDDSEIALELGIPGTTYCEVKHSKGDARRISDPWAENNAIVVTKEVTLTVSQEDQIENVIGF
ncbi:hypothetical protein SLS53_004564 [Cytospora paraplurivora]|uniref:Rhodopsin domain-containing protein n=1 Tax=Cytospora paraplurivora TaxID=2898453 RepID=A0AAN9YH17_9PEZI